MHSTVFSRGYPNGYGDGLLASGSHSAVVMVATGTVPYRRGVPLTRHWVPVGGAAVLIALACTPAGRAMGQRFFASLRIAKPQAVTAGPATPTNGSSSRPLEDAIGGMLSPATKVTADEPPHDIATLESAARTVGFQPRLMSERKDKPTLFVLGAYDAEMPVDPAQLRTILQQAGRKDVMAAESLKGTTLRVRVPLGVRAEYGHCPARVANTIQGQLQGPPPPSTDYGDCVILTQTPRASIQAPASLDVAGLVEIALELSGMSPSQTRAFQQRFDPSAALALTPPRSIRSYDLVDIGASHGMLLNTAARRGPTYVLAWPTDSLVFVLAGYGNSGDAIRLANSIR